MPKKKPITRRPRRPRRMRGGYIPSSLGENNINALQRISVGENNLAAIAALQHPKPPMQPLGQVVNIPSPIVNIPYPITGNVPFFDRVRGALKRSKIISRGARALGAHGVARYADQFGYGRKRRHRGGARYAIIDRYGQFVPAY